MSSIGVKIPITYDSGDGFTMLKTLDDTIKQNLKMLILTTWRKSNGTRIWCWHYAIFIFNFSENDTEKLLKI